MRRVKRAFTLIELMVVVAIFAIVAAILIPNFLRVREKGLERREKAQAVALPSPPPGVAPDIRSLKGALTLRTSARREGMEVVNRYELSYDAQLVFARPPHSAGPVLLTVPFPLAAETRDVKLLLKQGAREWAPDDVLITPQGLYWSADVTDEMTAAVSFVSSGQSRLAVPLPPSSRLQQLELSVNRAPGAAVSLDSLQPSGQEHDGFSWSYTNLVSPKPVVLDLPANQSQLARILLLCRLVGLAVLLFGLGFWYVGELYSPGRLNSFRWGQFFLLALTYSFFFPVLAVLTLGSGLTLAQGLGWAAGLSLPLLVLHVSRIVNLRFALFYTTPLAVLTLALVVNGVFGGAWRELFYLAASFVTIAFLTLSYRRWHNHRCQAQLLRENDLGVRVEALGEQARLARDEATRAGELCETCPVEEVRERALKARQNLLGQIYEAESLTQEMAELPALAPFSRRCEVRAQLEVRCDFTERQLPLARRELNLASHHALESQARARARLNAAPSEVYCLSCGQPGGPTPCCAQCGHKRPRRLDCSCGCQLLLPPEGKLGTFCPGCGQRRAELEG